MIIGGCSETDRGGKADVVVVTEDGTAVRGWYMTSSSTKLECSGIKRNWDAVSLNIWMKMIKKNSLWNELN